MKQIMLVCAVLLLSHFAKAQHIESLSNRAGKPSTLGAYGALQGKITAVDGKFAVLTGGYGGVFLNKKILLGAAGYSLANRIDVPGQTDRQWGLWYTGGVFEYVFQSDRLIHWSAGALVGGGGVSQRTGYDKGRDEVHVRSGFAVAEPFINAELNITRYLRVIAGGSWRQTFGTGSRAGITDARLSAPAFHLGIKAGLF
ncbi:hypothetical protein [Chitinophaga cymbidii]|uniref:Outer membrane protein beta-barrel domain-containing protein n=1 Tax=Chitinophaga cymbidii TaxID=1096750 RepID=A0A512RQF9_9BACT|nr:hypothetical protein [Chitinophaga cymbidii]GEP97926.1 hypothetical protein CCY01nite_41860 [Chitinophaga cymbidii]